jgi:8-amino-7-oxononanoate synthase
MVDEISSLLNPFKTKLQTLADQQLIRVLRAAETGTAPHQRVHSGQHQGPHTSQDLLMFCSNDYLGLAAHPDIAAALVEGVDLYGAGSGSSHLISGHSVAHQALEAALAAWVQPQIPQAQALYFCTGYMANLAVISALADEHTAIFSEALNHASLIDGIRLARAKGAQMHRYPHLDMATLAEQLAQSPAAVKLIVTDAVFSMDGELAPLADLLALAEQHQAWLVVDDAHGFGVLGPNGQGTLAHFGCRSQRLILVGTLGKAAGVAGAFVAAHPTLIQFLIQTARPYIFTTAAPPAVAHALLTSLALMQDERGQARREQLRRLQTQWQTGMRALLARRPDLGWTLIDSPTPIQPLVVGDNATALALAAGLEKRGIRVPAIRPPTVPAGTARLRVTLCGSHTEADVAQLLAALEAEANGQANSPT